MVLSIPTYIKQRSKLVIVISSLSTGLFFGSLMAVGTIIGKLDDGEGKPSQVDILSTRDENGELGFSSRPYWMPSIKQLNSD